MFNENSVIVKTWVSLVLAGTYTREQAIFRMWCIKCLMERKENNHDIYKKQYFSKNLGKFSGFRSIYIRSGSKPV